MREIKFRVWDKCNKRMVEPRNILKICMSRLNQEPYLIVYLKKYMNANREIKESDKSYTNEFELMQSIGLKDKKGVEIYEGDALNNYTSIQQPQGYLEDRILGEVKVINGMTYLAGEQSQTINGETIVSTYKCLLLSPEIFEIIGNIYESPELLHGNKTVRDQYEEWKNEI